MTDSIVKVEEVPARVVQLLQDQLGLPESPDTTAHLIADLCADSLDAVEVIMALEEEFTIELPQPVEQEIIDQDWTVQQLIDYVKKEMVK